jgi:hypothetical protein
MADNSTPFIDSVPPNTRVLIEALIRIREYTEKQVMAVI